MVDSWTRGAARQIYHHPSQTHMYPISYYSLTDHVGMACWVGVGTQQPWVRFDPDTSRLQVRYSTSCPTWPPVRVATPPGKPWFFFLKIPGPGMSWKSTLVLESHGNWRLRFWKVLEKYCWKLRIFVGSNGKQAEIVNVAVCVAFHFYLFLKTTTLNILLHATVSAMDYTPNVVSKRCLFFIFKYSWAPKRSWKISHVGPGKVLDFFPVKEWEPWPVHLPSDHSIVSTLLWLEWLYCRRYWAKYCGGVLQWTRETTAPWFRIHRCTAWHQAGPVGVTVHRRGNAVSFTRCLPTWWNALTLQCSSSWW